MKKAATITLTIWFDAGELSVSTEETTWSKSGIGHGTTEELGNAAEDAVREELDKINPKGLL